MRNQDEINAEIETLRTIKPSVRHYTAFGDDNHAAIDAQIEALEEDWSSEDIYSNDDLTDRERDEAIYARSWADGEEEDAPSEGWKPLMQ